MLNIRLSQDLCAAILFAVVGASAILFSQDLEWGSSADMGPGYMPRALGWMILGIAAIIGLKAIRFPGQSFGTLNLRPSFCILGAVVLFGLTIEPLGFVIASALGVFVSLFAMSRPSLPYVVAMTLLLPAVMSLVFVVGLGLPFDLWWF